MKTATIRNKGGDMVEVLVYDQIGRDPFLGDGIDAKSFRDQIKAIGRTKTINLRLNSPGGSVTEAAAMMAVLDEHPGRIVVDIDGLAASAASVLAMAGDEVRIASNGLLMVHDPSAGVMGGADDMRRMADLLEKVKGQLVDAYARRAKVGRDKLSEMMSAETWLSASEAVELGLADSVTGAVAVSAMAGHLALVAKLGAKRTPHVVDDSPAMQETLKRRARAARL